MTERIGTRRLAAATWPLLLLALVVFAVALFGCGGGDAERSSTAPSASSVSSTSVPSSASSTALATPQVHVVYAVGDSTLPGNEAVSSAVAGRIPLPSEGLELFLYLGDVYPSGSPVDFVHYDSIFGASGRDLRPKTASVVGNHESPSRDKGWIPYWSGRLVTPWPGSLTQTDPPYYTIELGRWKFILLDTGGDLSADGDQYAFLVRELKEPGYHCVVAGHIPRWSTGDHGSDPELAAFWKAMCDYGAVAYVSGHEHNSQIQPARDAQGHEVSGGGCVQIVAGAGGAARYPLVEGPGNAAPAWGDDSHYALLRLTLRDQDFTADFVGEDGMLLHSQTFPAGPR